MMLSGNTSKISFMILSDDQKKGRYNIDLARAEKRFFSDLLRCHRDTSTDNMI